MSCSLHFPFPPARPRPCGRHPWASVPTRLSAYGYCWAQVQGHAASWRLAFAETARPGKARTRPPRLRDLGGVGMTENAQPTVAGLIEDLHPPLRYLTAPP